MPRNPVLRFLIRPEQPALSIRTRSSWIKLPMVIGESFAKLAGYLGSLGEHPSRSSLCRLPQHGHGRPGCWGNRVPGGARCPVLRTSNMPLSRRASVRFCMYQGALQRRWRPSMAIWPHDTGNGYSPRRHRRYEFYYNGPDVPEPQLRHAGMRRDDPGEMTAALRKPAG